MPAKGPYGDDDLEFGRRFMGEFPKPSPGQLLYERWCGSRHSDRARYWTRMNPAEKAAWENVAQDFLEVDPVTFERVIHNLPEETR